MFLNFYATIAICIEPLSRMVAPQAQVQAVNYRATCELFEIGLEKSSFGAQFDRKQGKVEPHGAKSVWLVTMFRFLTQQKKHLYVVYIFALFYLVQQISPPLLKSRYMQIQCKNNSWYVDQQNAMKSLLKFVHIFVSQTIILIVHEDNIDNCVLNK